MCRKIFASIILVAAITTVFVSNSVAQNLIAEIPSKPTQEGYGKFYHSDGRAKPTYTQRLKKRFGARLNLATDPATLSEAEKTKWNKIMIELQRAVDRTSTKEDIMMFVPKDEAKKRSVEFHKNGTVSDGGAWSVALLGTAVRYRFTRTPCAEFVGETIRQAYKRAGYSHTEDFNKERKNSLSTLNGASRVTNLSNYLNKAGWTPWEASKYIPPAGAPVMHMTGISPGHAYFSGGRNGQLVVDNAYPKGVDLGQLTGKRIAYMYLHGVFFLPPGVIPQRATTFLE